jgi:hypothetical protein
MIEVKLILFFVIFIILFLFVNSAHYNYSNKIIIATLITYFENKNNYKIKFNM